MAPTRPPPRRWPRLPEIAIVFVNQPTSEGRDLPTLTLPDKQDELVSAVAAANPHTIVVLETGGPAAMPWIGQVERRASRSGTRASAAPKPLANILFGDVNPCAKLPVTFAKSRRRSAASADPRPATCMHRRRAAAPDAAGCRISISITPKA